MTAIIDRDVITAAQEAAAEAQALVRHGSAAAGRRGATRARGVSPRLARSRSVDVASSSITSSNDVLDGGIRTEPAAVRVTGARGSARRTVERPGVRSAARRAPRGYSRADGCARRAPGPSLAACVLFATGVFAGLLVLFGGSSSAEPTPTAAQPALTSIVTVRTGQSLEQIAREIAPDRAQAAVVAEIAEINGLRDGRVHAGQTLITPRY
ncbi:MULTISPECIES: LysM peptidoglycan-binding domain-containing protein [Tsukamurella]|uniref:LysM peptidoglycan-binding domain-containing protein n=2 Tax=Tsukamurella TaxID=2060 RepID=A0A5C5S053_9ACTN|nr:MULTISPECIES: LysM peptidoglycan-binding domain-containing protein [Tsukamurella]NMD56133.1 LysM peptidoglycan-binding domain-containing protein [Tsukamurella columbiensis]TWS28766.1 LysM peptidoglycan-binding domain-containing protein [Tsukamurella conjunctivitidis]